MELSLKDLKKIKDALGTLDAEYGDEEALELRERVKEVIERRRAEWDTEWI